MKKKSKNKDNLSFIYNNDMNYVQFKDFNAMELNLFFTLCALMKEQGLQTITLTFSEIRNLIKFKKTDTLSLIKLFESTYDKMINLKFRIGDSFNFEKFVLFTGYVVKGSDKKVEITVNPRFEYILNNFKNVLYTAGEVEIFNTFSSRYTKLLFKELLSQKKSGKRFFRIEEFRRLLDIPESYRMSEINKKVLVPIDKELPSFFKKFEYEKIYKGKEVTNINFSFTLKDKKNIEKLDEIKIEVEEAEIIEEDDIEKFWKDNFIGVNYTSKHKAIVEKMKEKDSISYIKNYLIEQWNYVEKNQRIKNKAAYFSSLILEKKAILKDCIVHKKANDKEDKLQADNFIKELEEKTNTTRRDIELEQISLFITEITKEEYEEIYQEYLKNNNLDDNESNRLIFKILSKNKYKIS